MGGGGGVGGRGRRMSSLIFAEEDNTFYLGIVICCTMISKSVLSFDSSFCRSSPTLRTVSFRTLD